MLVLEYQMPSTFEGPSGDVGWTGTASSTAWPPWSSFFQHNRGADALQSLGLSWTAVAEILGIKLSYNSLATGTFFTFTHTGVSR